MHMVVCPHCKTQRIFAARPPKDIVVVMPCPSCQELVVLFRDRVIALNRRIIEQGTREERKRHLADIIDQFLEAGVLNPEQTEDSAESTATTEEASLAAGQPSPDSLSKKLITQEELERFLRIDLKCIDNAAYFKKHFG
jgi:hypothetical protein